MKTTALKTTVLTLIAIASTSTKIYSQSKNITLNEDPKFEQMLNEKRKINTSITVNDRYKIQVYNGDSETSKRTLADFKREFKDCDGTIIFNTPTYKVWVGNYRSRIEAERNLAEIKQKYPNAFLIRPNK